MVSITGIDHRVGRDEEWKSQQRTDSCSRSPYGKPVDIWACGCRLSMILFSHERMIDLLFQVSWLNFLRVVRCSVEIHISRLSHLIGSISSR